MAVAAKDMAAFLESQLKNVRKELNDIKSGAWYRKIEEGKTRFYNYYNRKLSSYLKIIEKQKKDAIAQEKKFFKMLRELRAYYDGIIKKLEKELSGYMARQYEYDVKSKEFAAEIERLNGRVQELEDALNAQEEATKDQEDQNKALQAQLNNNSENSSIPTSKDNFRGKVPNNREKTNRSPGAQPNHEGHGRPFSFQPDKTTFIPAPPEIANNPDYYIPNGGTATIRKQRIRIGFVVEVEEYWTYEYRNRKTGARYHAPFPDGQALEVDYDDSVRALIFLMKNHLNVPEEKTREFLSMITDGKLNVSRGMINNINKEFAQKSAQEQEKIIATLMESPVMYTDLTNARMNGKQKYIMICSNGKDAAYYFRDSKGFKAVEDTALEKYDKTVVHDHDKTWFHFGTKHQDCNEHHLRYLKGAAENEPELEWHGQMRSLLQEMDHTWKKQDHMMRPDQVENFETRYDEILDLADKEYAEHPPTNYYKKGCNLATELREYKDSTLLFLHDPNVEFTNDIAERYLRKAKRHLGVSGTFRGKTNHSGEEYCQCLGVFETARANQDGNIYEYVKSIFRRPRAPAPQS